MPSEGNDVVNGRCRFLFIGLLAGLLLMSSTVFAQGGLSRSKPPATKRPNKKTPSRPTNEAANGEWDGVTEAKKLELGIEYKKPRAGERFSFNLVDADLIELVKIIGNITGKSFIIGGTVPKVKATIYAPTKINRYEAYRTFLSVLAVNGLTVIPSGRYLKIEQVKNPVSQKTPIVMVNQDNDQIVTRLHQLKHVKAEDLADLLGRFKSAQGDITVYSPTNTLIITDYGSSIKRLMRLVGHLDIPGSNENIYVEPINHASADELAKKIEEIFEMEGGSSGSSKKRPAARKATKGKKAAPSAPESFDSSTVVNYSKVIADDRTNTIIIMASEAGYVRILELIKVLDIPVAGEGTLHVVKLQHASAEDLVKPLGNITKRSGKGAAKGKNGEGSLFEGEVEISADKATNSLIIVSSMRDFASLKSVIDKLDTMQRQVFVEAVIMQVSIDKDKQFGMGLHGGKTLNNIAESSFGYGKSQPSGAPSSLSPVDALSVSGLAAGASFGEIEVMGLSIPAFGVAMNALQANTDVNVLSNPHILATDNEEASITVGENVPVLQGVNSSAALLGALGSSSGSTANIASALSGSSLSGLTSNYKRQDVGITLSIVPHINDDSQVRLEIELEISEVKSDSEKGPTISKQNATTVSVVADQQTFVLGGLMKDKEERGVTKVPVLGDIPLLGMLFRHKVDKKVKRNLLIFLTPYIIRSADDFKAIYERKMAERKEFIERYTAFQYHEYDPHTDWTRTNGAVSVISNVITDAQSSAELEKYAARAREDDHSVKAPINFPTPGGDKKEIVIEPDAKQNEAEVAASAESGNEASATENENKEVSGE